MGDVGIGPDLIFSREPIRSMDDLKRYKMWIWDLDDVFAATWPQLGVPVVRTRIDEAYRAYENKNVDGFLAVPTAALAYQWSAQARYVTDLRLSFLRACILVSTRAFDSLPLDARNALLNTTAKGMMQLEQLGRSQDEQLLGGLFAKQGLKMMNAPEPFRADFFARARAVREQLGPQLVRPALLSRVLALLADYRAEHRAVEGEPK
jgi:TRAP-type C4-dicarboxylate transport system substrate-binding protein